MDISIFIQWFTFSRENIKHWQIWMSDEGHNCFIIVFSTVATYNNSSYFLVSYRSMSPTTKENIRHIYQPVWQSLPYIFFFHLILAMSSSMHRVILIYSSGVSWAGDSAILDALQTNYAVGSLARERWNVWTVTIALLPVIVNFCEAWFLIVRQFHPMKIF